MCPGYFKLRTIQLVYNVYNNSSVNCCYILWCCRSLPNHKLSGPISADIGKLASLQFLYTSHTSWHIFISYPLHTELNFLLCRALHDNNLYGSIPAELGNCTLLQSVWVDTRDYLWSLEFLQNPWIDSFISRSHENSVDMIVCLRKLWGIDALSMYISV